MLFGNSTVDILTGWCLGMLSWISMLFYGLIIYDLIWEFKSNAGGMNGQQQNVTTKFYQLLTISIYGFLGISLNFVLRVQLWIEPESEEAQPVALFPYIRPFFGKIVFIINAALLFMFTSIQLPFILAQFGFFQNRHGKHRHFLLFALPSIVLPLVLCLFLSQMEIPDLRIYSWLFNEFIFEGKSFSGLDKKWDLSNLQTLLNAYIGNKEFNGFASLMSTPQNVTLLENDTRFRLQQMLTQLVNESAEVGLDLVWDRKEFERYLSNINNCFPILKPSLINANALLLIIPVFLLLILSICAAVPSTILLIRLKNRRSSLMKQLQLDIDEIQLQKIQQMDQQIKTAVLNFVQDKYQPYAEYIMLTNYEDINGSNLTHLLVAVYSVVPLLNFVFSTRSRQQKLKIWLHNCWFTFWKKCSEKLSPKLFIVLIAVAVIAALIYYSILIGTISSKAFSDFNKWQSSRHVDCKGHDDDTIEFEGYKNTIRIIYWAFLSLNLLFTHSMIKFAWNHMGVLTILNFHFGELLRAAFHVYERLPWCGGFRSDQYMIGYGNLVHAYIDQFMHSFINNCLDWTPLLIALHRFHIIMVPMHANQFWRKKRIIKACILFWIVMIIPAIDNFYMSILIPNYSASTKLYVLNPRAQDMVVNEIIHFLESSGIYIFIGVLYAAMFCKFTWETLFSTSVQILSSCDQFHETRSETLRITAACFLAYWLPRYVQLRAQELMFLFDPFEYLMTMLDCTYFLVEAISLMVLSRQYRSIVLDDLRMLPALVSKLWRAMRGGSTNQILPQNNNDDNGRNQRENGWVGNLETTF